MPKKLLLVFTLAALCSTAASDARARLAEAEAQDAVWNQDQERLEHLLLADPDACDAAVPHALKSTWNAHRRAISAWLTYYGTLRQDYESRAGRFDADQTLVQSNLARLAKLRREAETELAEARARKPGPADAKRLATLTEIRRRTLQSSTDALEILLQVQARNTTQQNHIRQLQESVRQMETMVQVQDTGWRHYYRGELLALRAEARARCPDVFAAKYRELDPSFQPSTSRPPE